MKHLVKPLLCALLLGSAAFTATEAEAARVVIGVGVGIPFGYGYGYGYGPGYWAPYGYYAPRVVVVPPAEPPVYVSPAPAAPDPIFYPAKGQSAAQTEADRQECNRWAAGQPAAMADAGVFQRATYACMEGRGYTVR